jgi:creatinine amidohydrolase
MRLGEMTWKEVEETIAGGASAIIPLGSIEEHGPHAPMGDYAVVDEIAARTAQATGDLVVPTLPFGYSEYFRHYPGTITFRSETLSAAISDIVDCLVRHQVKRIVIFNGHAGNAPIIELETRRLRRQHGLLIPTLSPLQQLVAPEIARRLYDEGAELAHGGEPMGSVMLALTGKTRPDLIATHERKRVLGLETDGLGAVKFNGVRVGLPLDMREVAAESGSLSDPGEPNAERGEALLAYASEFCIEFMRWFATVDPTVEPA